MVFVDVHGVAIRLPVAGSEVFQIQLVGLGIFPSGILAGLGILPIRIGTNWDFPQSGLGQIAFFPNPASRIGHIPNPASWIGNIPNPVQTIGPLFPTIGNVIG